MKSDLVPVYRSDLVLQRGRGLGSLFRGLSRFLVPTLKAATRTVLKTARHPLAREVGKNVGKHLAKVAVTTLGDMQEGTPGRQALKRRFKEQLPAMTEDTIKAMQKGRGRSVVHKRRRTKRSPQKRKPSAPRDIFDE